MERLCETDGDHIRFDLLAEPNAGVKAFCDDIDELILGENFQLNVRIGGAEIVEEKFAQIRSDGARHVQAQQSRHVLAESLRHVKGVRQLCDGGTRALEKSLAGFGQANPARGAGKKRHPCALFQSSDSLAHGRRRDAKFVGRGAEALSLGNAEKRQDAVELIAADCEALLHKSCHI